MNQSQQRVLEDDFDVWWQHLPHDMRVGKLAARKLYIKARSQTTREALLDGVAEYERTKPADQWWCHASTFLRQGRWLDERPAPQRKVAGSLQKWWD